MRTQAERDYGYLVTRKRKNLGLVTRTFAKATLDAGRLAQGGHRPFYMGQGLYEGCRNIADYCEENEIGNVIMVDKSARPLWVGVAEYWKLAHADKPRPNIHFINPTLFRGAIRGSESPAELTNRIQRAGQVCMEQMVDARSPLAENPEKPVMLADACLHSGRAVYLTRLVLGAAGFSDIRVGVVKTTLSRNAPYTPDTYGANSVLSARCFRSEVENGLVVNDETSIYSAAVADPAITLQGAAVRQRIGALIYEGFADEQARLPHPVALDSQPALL